MKNRFEILQEIKDSPEIALLVNDLQILIANEKNEREKYYNLVHENVKAEFINNGRFYQTAFFQAGHFAVAHTKFAQHFKNNCNVYY